MRAMKFGVGQPVKRVEDVRLVSGQGAFASDYAPEGALHAAFLRCPHAHAKFAVTDIEGARALPGVHGVFVASDFSALGELPCLAKVPNSDGSMTPAKPYPVMADEEAHHVGDIVAMAVADTLMAGARRPGSARGGLGGAAGGRRRRGRHSIRRGSGLSGRARAISSTTRRSATGREPTRSSRRPPMWRGSRS